jgi:hypothetical protein
MPGAPLPGRHFGASGAGSGARRVVGVTVVAFLAGIAFRAIVLADHPGSPPAPTAVATPVGATDAVKAPAGPSRTEKGVPAGFSGDEAGAVAAAAAFVATGQALLDMDPIAVEDAVRQMASAGAADRQVSSTLDELGRLRDVLAAGSGPIVFRQSPVAWRVESFAPGRARVAVWNVGVLSRVGVAAPQAAWQISTYDLVWERGDWRNATETVVPGPAPLLDNSAAPATAGQLLAALDRFSAFTAWRSR